ncbi:MAG: alpha/beta fold hydrolase [Pseudonocardiaceae bacterium]|nr:alpha/beta fold hydrolase [Pseudonocardiaceae bacterium]
MRQVWKVAGWIGGALGTSAAVATAAQRTRIARQRREGGTRELSELPLGRESTVTADDGVPLSVEQVDPADGGEPELSVVLVHGYTLDRRSWYFQRRDLATSQAPRVRQVLYDQRSHGRSGRAPRRTCTIDQLAHDLDSVIRAVAPTGPVVLLGHSMGGMTIMALAEGHPELFAERICGVALLNTSAGEIGSSGLPRPFLSRYNPVMVVAGQVAAWQPTVVERGRALGNQLLWGLVRRFAFADPTVSTELVDLVDSMIGATPVEVMTDFLKTLGAHDRYSALAGLRHVEVLVLGAEADLMIPYQHSEAIAALLPDAELVCVPGAGHMAMLERPEFVTETVRGLVSRCVARESRRRRA